MREEMSPKNAPRMLSLWYLDDGLLFGPPNMVNQAWKTVETEAAKVGLKLNESKCEVWNAKNRAAIPDIPENVPDSDPEGFELLGIGVGKPSFCNRILHKRVLKIKEALAKLDIIDDPQIELTLLRCCMGFPRFAFAIRSTPPDMVSEAIAFFDQIMDETAEDRFDIAFSDRRKRQWHMPIRMGGVGIPRAEDAAAPAYLANTIDCCDLVREMLGKDDIEPLSNPGAGKTWDEFKKAANTKIDLPPNIEELLKQLKLSGNHPGSDDLTSFLRKHKQPGEKTQHFLNSTLQQLRLRELLATMDPRNAEDPGETTSRREEDICQEPTERALLRTLALIRGNQDTGYANSWLNVVPCSAHGTKMNKPTFAISLKWMMGDVICPEGQCPETSATNKRCPHRLDPFGDHAVCCATGPSRIARHDHVNATWMATLSGAGYHVRAEVRTSSDTRKRSADTLVYNWDKGSMAAHDWTISHVLRPQGLKAKTMDPNWAIKEAEARKIRTENGECLTRGIEFTPLAMDTFGGIGQLAARAICRVANHCRIRNDNDEVSKNQKRLAQKLRFAGHGPAKSG